MSDRNWDRVSEEAREQRRGEDRALDAPPPSSGSRGRPQWSRQEAGVYTKTSSFAVIDIYRFVVQLSSTFKTDPARRETARRS